MALLLSVTTLGHAADVYVATTGNNNNSGTIDAPYRTITYAVGKMSAGDVCYIRGGIYREKVTLTKNDLTLSAYGDEFVAIYGTKTLSDWEQYEGEIYRTKVTGSDLTNVNSNTATLKSFPQVIFDGQMQKMARYPDHTTDDMFSLEPESGYTKIEIEEGSTALVTFDEPIPGNFNDYAGGYFRAISGKAEGTNPTGRILISDTYKLICEDINKPWESALSGSSQAWKTLGEGRGYIYHLKALTQEGEWYFQDDYLYYWQPGGGKPADDAVEIQIYENAIIASSKSGITLKNLNIRAAAMDMSKCNDLTVEGCSFRDTQGWIFRMNYAGSFTELGGVYYKGENATFKNCYFDGAWGNQLNLDNTENVTIDNCIFQNSGWLGLFTSAIQHAGYNLVLTNNTFGSAGRFHLRSDGHSKLTILHNDFYDCMKMCQDAGSIELTNTSLQPAAMNLNGSEFAYNKFHDMNTRPSWVEGRTTTQFVVALYMEGAENYTVHHNLFYNITNENNDGSFLYLGPRTATIDDCFFYNNTIWNIDCRIRIWNYTDDGSSGQINNMLFYNNIFESDMRDEWGDLQSQITMADNEELPYSQGTSHFIDPTNGNFQLQTNSSLKDAGREVGGITDGYIGTAPDLGCFEQGVEPWTCGSSLTPYFPDEDPNAKQKQILIRLR